MLEQGSKKFINFNLLIAGAIIIICILYFNHMVQESIKEKNEISLEVSVFRAKNLQLRQSANSLENNSQVGVIRKTNVIRGSDYLENVFYIGNQEIARQKSSSQGILEESGQIPDGEAKFFDQYTHTYGNEHYWNGKKEGIARVYYEDGQLMSEGEYNSGKLVRNREYYPGGNLRFEVDYTDAREGKSTDEVGIGKLYYPNGQLKYEWYMTRHNPIGYKKSYNQDGSLRAEVYFDEQGKPK